VESQRNQIRRLHRAGGSLIVTVPSAMAKFLGVGAEDQVWVYLVGHVLCMKRFDEGGFTPEVVAVRSQESGVRSRE